MRHGKFPGIVVKENLGRIEGPEMSGAQVSAVKKDEEVELEFDLN